MNITHQNITLDMNKNDCPCVLNAHQGDKGTRFIDVKLTMSGEEIMLNTDYTVVIKASNNGIVKAINLCDIDAENNIAIVELTDIMLDTPGVLNCEISLLEEDKIITSQFFKVNIAMSTVNNEKDIEKSQEYGLLVKLIQDVYNVLNVITNGNEVYY